jgi:hypothetical protein
MNKDGRTYLRSISPRHRLVLVLAFAVETWWEGRDDMMVSL